MKKKTPGDFAANPAIAALNAIASIAAVAGGLNTATVKAESVSASGQSLSIQSASTTADINYNTATQQSTVLQYGGRGTFTTTQTQSYQIGRTGYNVDDAKSVQD
jgi:hypothetical protein